MCCSCYINGVPRHFHNEKLRGISCFALLKVTESKIFMCQITGNLSYNLNWLNHLITCPETAVDFAGM